MNLKTISSKFKKTCLFILTILKNKKFYHALFTSIITYITWGYATIEKRVDDLKIKEEIRRLVGDRYNLLALLENFEFAHSELGYSVENLILDIKHMLKAILMNDNLAYQSLETQKSFELVKQHVLYTPFLNCRLYDKIATYSYILSLDEIKFTHLYNSSDTDKIKIYILQNFHCYTELNNAIKRIL